MKFWNYCFFCLSLFYVDANLSAQQYFAAESVEWDPVNDQWLVSNGLNIIADDGEGNLSVFGSSAAGFGMEVLGNTIFGSTTDGIVGLDLITEEEVLSVSIPGTFLNGLTNDGDSLLYATDFTNNRIYKINVSDIENPTEEILVNNTIERPNGILYDDANNRLIYLTWELNAKIKQVDLSDLSISTLASTDMGFLDGIATDGAGNYYVSSWSPNAITKFSDNFTTSELVNTPALMSPADIGYNQEDNIIGIPMATDVIFVDVDEGSVDVEEPNEGHTRFEVLNSDGQIYLQISLLKPDHIDIDVFDINGRWVSKVVNGKMDIGKSHIQLDTENFNSGTYIAVLTTSEGYTITQKIIIP